jgi:hypothetical protein
MGTGESRPDETCRVCKGSGADPSPGASERRTLFVIETLAKGVVWIETGHRRGALDVAQEDLRANPPGQFPKRIVRVTEIRDVIAAGEKEGGSK